MKGAEIIGLRIKCPKQLPVRHIPRGDYAIGPWSSERRYYVVRCDCGEIHHIRMRAQEAIKPIPKNKKPTKG